MPPPYDEEDGGRVVEFPNKKGNGEEHQFSGWRRTLVDGHYRHEKALERVDGKIDDRITELRTGIEKQLEKIRTEQEAQHQKIVWAYAFAAGAAAVIGVILKFIGK